MLLNEPALRTQLNKSCPKGSYSMENAPNVFINLTSENRHRPLPAAPLSKVSGTKDATEVFWELSRLCYSLFTVLGAVGQFINDTLKDDVASLAARNSAQALVLDSGPQPSADPPKENAQFPFGGTGENGLKRANDLMDYFHKFSIGNEFPPGYDKNNGTRISDAERKTVTVGQFKTWVGLMQNQIDRLKNNSTVETTKANGSLQSINAAMEMSTAVIKNITTTLQAVATKI
jgi:hypothetical protein